MSRQKGKTFSICTFAEFKQLLRMAAEHDG
jgi:hypothetical protein